MLSRSIWAWRIGWAKDMQVAPTRRSISCTCRVPLMNLLCRPLSVADYNWLSTTRIAERQMAMRWPAWRRLLELSYDVKTVCTSIGEIRDILMKWLCRVKRTARRASLKDFQNKYMMQKTIQLTRYLMQAIVLPNRKNGRNYRLRNCSRSKKSRRCQRKESGAKAGISGRHSRQIR